MKKVLHLIDGSGYIFRAYYAIRPLSTAAGEPTNASMGFATMIEKALRDEQPSRLAIVFDAGGPGFRQHLYPEYKAHRPPPPEDLSAQIPRIHQLAEAFAIPKLVEPGVEADDVIATLTRMALAEGAEVVIVTGDKDLMQLVGEHVTLFEPMKNVRFTPAVVEEKMGVPPHLVGDALALAGDTADNVPGVRGVGMKTAAKLLADHGGLAGVLAAAKAGKIKGKLGETLAASEADALLSRALVTLREDVPLAIRSIDELVYRGPNTARLRELYVELELRRLVPKLDAAAASAEAPPEAAAGEDAEVIEGDESAAEPSRPRYVAAGIQLSRAGYRAVTTMDALRAEVEGWRRAGTLALAVEASTARMVDAELHGLAVAAARGQARYVPFAGPRASSGLDPAAVLEALAPLLEDPTVAKVSAESKLVSGLAARFGVQLRGLAFDTTLASYLLEPDETQHGYAQVARRFLGHEPLDRAAVLGPAKEKRTFLELSLERATELVGERTDVALAASEIMSPALRSAGVLDVLTSVELPLVPVLARMEREGVKIDLFRLASMSGRFAEEQARLEKLCYEAAGQEFNLGSPKQLQKVLFEDLGLKIVKRTKTGPSTDQSVLEALADAHPLPQALLDYRQVQKLKSTYVDALPKMVAPRTGRVHTTFGQSTAATGRLSSTDPNLQNIPIRSELGRELRKVFVAEPGCLLVSVDYSQIELRVLAHFSRDEVLVRAFAEGADVHTRTAAALFGVPPEAVDREQRTQAKAVNFGVLYGMGPVRLARELKIPRRVASQFVSDYFERQPGVKRFIDQTLEDARRTSEVRTLLGRRRLVADVNSRNRTIRSAAERVAVNTPIQGSAADLIKLAMIRVDAVLRERFPSARLILQVHDELLLEAPEGEAAAVAAMVKQEMEHIFPLEVPLTCEAKFGPDWGAAH
jgi:DNA polymerase-1